MKTYRHIVLFFIASVAIVLTACNNSRNEKEDPTNDLKKSILERNIFSADSLFQLKKDSSKFKLENQNISVTIGDLFLNKNKYAIFRLRVEDSVSLVYILKQKRTVWDTIFKQTIFPIDLEMRADYEQRIELEDFNCDKIPDLKIQTHCYHSPMVWYHDLWVFKKDAFTKINGFSDIVNPSFDKQTNAIYAYESEGCADMSMYFASYKINDNRVQLKQEIHCDCCEEDSCRIQVVGGTELVVAKKKAHLYVPKFYAEMVKWKSSY